MVPGPGQGWPQSDGRRRNRAGRIPLSSSLRKERGQPGAPFTDQIREIKLSINGPLVLSVAMHALPSEDALGLVGTVRSRGIDNTYVR